MNVGIKNDIDTHNVYLFLITKETPVFSNILKTKFKCDFLLIKFESPFKYFKKLESESNTKMEESGCNTYVDIESIAQDRITDIGGCIKYDNS